MAKANSISMRASSGGSGTVITDLFDAEGDFHR